MGLLPKSRARITREAADWVVRLGGQSSEHDRAAFRRWHDSNPRHAEAYGRISGIWAKAGELAPSGATGGVEHMATFRRQDGFRFALAASLAAVILVPVLVIGSQWLTPPAPEPQTMVLAAALGEIEHIDLPDGSRVIIDSASRVDVAYSAKERRLILRDGQARFQVAHEDRPFVVRAGSSEVIATGTLFDVSLIGGRMTVALFEGSVIVRPTLVPGRGEASGERLTPGQELVLAPSAPPVRGQTSALQRTWPTRMLQFDGTRLADAIATANRYSRTKIRIGSDRIADLRVNGAFRVGDSAGLGRSLASAFKLRLVVEPDGNLLLAEPAAWEAAQPGR